MPYKKIRKFCGNECTIKWRKEHPPIPKGITYEKHYGVLKAKQIKKKIGIKSLGRQARLGIPFTPEQLKRVLRTRTPNKDELKLNKILKTNWPKEWKFVGDGKVWIQGKNPDFININGKKLIIELFGNRWHEEKEADERKKIFAKYGYQTFILWDYELKNKKKTTQMLENFININKKYE